MRRFFSRFSYTYPKSLTYIFQASEYNIGDYLKWYRRVSDFTRVEKRKNLVWTKKAILLFSGIIFLILFVISLGIFLFFTISGNMRYLGILLIVFYPFVVPYLATLPLILIKFLIQKPLESSLINETKEIIDKSKAIRIAIAGSYGKTSAREILKTILSEQFKVSAPSHSYNTPLGISRFVQKLSGNEEILIFELGEYYKGDVDKLCRIVKPRIGIITGINDAHLEKFKTIENTASTIFELSDYLHNKEVYINSENGLIKKYSRINNIEYGFAGTKSIKISDVKASLEGTEFTIKSKERKIRTKSFLLGKHQIGIIAAAADIALKLGMSLEQIDRGIRKTTPFEHRMSPRTDSSGVTVIDDTYNGNPDGVKAIIGFLKELECNRRIYVTPGLVEMGKRAEEIHREIGKELANANIDVVILIENSVTPYIEKGLSENAYKGRIIKYKDALKAYAAIPNLTIKGDVVVLQNDWPDQYF